MNIWQTFEVCRNTDAENQSISFHFEKGIDSDIKYMYISFARWLRSKYIFPIHINIYILNTDRVKLRNGKMAYGSFCWFEKRNPLIRIPSKIEEELLTEYTREELLEQMLSSLTHELTHYYQWLLGSEQTDRSSERQANYYRYKIIEQYYSDKEITGLL